MKGGMVRQNGRWYLTDFQRLFVVLTVATAVFIAAMALGLGSIVLAGVALLLLILVGLVVFLLGLRYSGRELAEGEARVLSVPAPPPGKIVSRCDLRLQVHLKGAPVTVMRHREQSVPLTKWPRVGTVLPIDLNPRTRTLRVRWERVEPHRIEPTSVPAQLSPRTPVTLDGPDDGAVPFFIDYADAPVSGLPQTTMVFDEDYNIAEDWEPPTRPGVSTIGPAVVPGARLPIDSRPAIGPAPTTGPSVGSDPSPTLRLPGTDSPTPANPSDAGPPNRPDSRPDPSGVDRRRSPWIISEPTAAAAGRSEPASPDLGQPTTGPADRTAAKGTGQNDPEPDTGEWPPVLDSESRARAAEYELPMRTIPQPRPAEPPAGSPAGSPPGPAGAESGAMGIMLVVSDLDRSVRFYRDLVGMSVVDQAANAAVLSYGGSRVVLRQLADMSPVDRRVSHLHIKVSDVESAYRDLVARGVQFVHVPRAITLGDKLDLWAATFRDPDGHDIALTQWRDKESGH